MLIKFNPSQVPEIHVIVISSVRPEPTSAGQIILHRHLMDQPGITLEVYGAEPKRPTLSRHIRRAAARLSRIRLRRWIEDFWVLWGGRWIDPELPTEIANPDRTIVLTVAHGDGFMAARRFAVRHRLPLVAFFHDWWPDMAQVHGPIRGILEARFRDLYRTASLPICVCQGMKDALGRHSNAHVLYPLPAKVIETARTVRADHDPFRILYSGNLADYGSMLGEALEASLAYPEILLQVRGSSPNWSEERKAKMRANGRWLAFAPRAELDAWLASADAFLIPMVFDPAIRRRMETSFPSKLIEFAQFGKPLIIWGPEYCSAVKWSRERNGAFCVTVPDPKVVVHEILDLLKDRPTGDSYAAAAKCAAATEFNSELIQQKFRNLLASSTNSPAAECRGRSASGVRAAQAACRTVK